MRLRHMVMPVLLALPTTAHAEQRFMMCSIRSNYINESTTDTVYYTGLMPYTFSTPQEQLLQISEIRAAAGAFITYLERRGLDILRVTSCDDHADDASARAHIAERSQFVRPGYFQFTGWTVRDSSIADRWVPGSGQAASVTAQPVPAPARRRTAPPASSAGSRPGVYIVRPNETLDQETAAQREASQRAVAAENARQLALARAAEAERQRAQAAHQAQLAENQRQQAAHRAQLAENERRQAAYRQARAEWEARVARCQSGDRAACVGRVTPQ